jgi:hypothetical protein
MSSDARYRKAVLAYNDARDELEELTLDWLARVVHRYWPEATSVGVNDGMVERIRITEVNTDGGLVLATEDEVPDTFLDDVRPILDQLVEVDLEYLHVVSISF